MNIASVSDELYLKYCVPCFNSFKKNKNVKYFLYYIGDSVPSFDNTILIQDNTFLSSVKNIEKNLKYEDNEYRVYFPDNKVYVSEKECYCNNIRFQYISNLLESCIKNLVFTDADMICNKKIDFLPTLCYKKDIALQHYYVDSNGNVSTNGNIRYRTNFMYINNTSNTRTLFSNLAAEIKKNYKFWGHVDIFTSFVLTQNNLKIAELPTDFIDTNYKNNSFIWSGESFRKHEDSVEASTKNNRFLNALNVYK